MSLAAKKQISLGAHRLRVGDGELLAKEGGGRMLSSTNGGCHQGDQWWDP